MAAAGLILLPALPLGRFDLLYLGALAALTAWTWLSWLWSESGPQTALEVERGIVYCGGALALLVIARRRSVPAALGGLLLAELVLCGHALATRLVPDQVTWPHSSISFRLAGVFGYPNALGIVAVMGLLLALAFALDSPHRGVRAASAAGTVPFALTLYFTNSRGAWGALVVGLLAAAAVAPSLRLLRTLLPLAIIDALVIWLASRSSELTKWTDPLAAAHDGHRVAFAAAVLAVAAALVTALPVRGLTAATPAIVLAVVLAAPGPARLLAAGTPGGGAEPGVTPGERFFSTTSNSRTHYWRVAWRDFVRHPVAGSGAGTFVREWYRHRTIRANVTDAHSLYLETLAELGLVGLVLVVLVLAVPAVAAVRVRGSPLVAGAFGAYAAFAAHLAVDWDWELPAVTLTGLFLGGLLVIAARREADVLVLDRRWRTPILAPVLALVAVSFVGLVGNRAEAAARLAVAREDWPGAAKQAGRAGSWAPWSAQALALQADAADGLGDRAEALDLLRRAAAKDSTDIGVWRRLATLATGAERRRADEQAALLSPLR